MHGPQAPERGRRAWRTCRRARCTRQRRDHPRDEDAPVHLPGQREVPGAGAGCERRRSGHDGATPRARFRLGCRVRLRLQQSTLS
jgi:hypothetical protein